MQGKKIRRAVWAALGCLWAVTAFAQEYRVSGGAKTPLLAMDNTLHRIQVWLVYGLDGVTLGYTSSSTAHRWYRYRTRALDYEPVASTQQGASSTVDRPEEGYGYFVMEGDNPAMAHFIWLIDYSLYPANFQNLQVADLADPCEALRLAGVNATPPLTYRTPVGDAAFVERQFEISYMTQVWNEALRQFVPVLLIDTLRGDPLNASATPPLDDTEIQLTGDFFARHFGVEETFSAGRYQAVALNVRADTLLLSNNQTNLSAGENELLAPATIRFTARANTPVAALHIWQVYRTEEPNNPLVRFPESEMEYIFDRVGDFTVRLEVSDRSGRCVNTENTWQVSITETQVQVPNAFTPQGSPGVNDVFKVAYKSVVRFRGWIFNRWGAELFSWTDPSQGWDGRYRGKYVPAGAYFYVIEYTGTDGKAHRKSGDVNVIRSTKLQKNTETE
ncbi:MAG: gliding motility-associated C-terminal domain-containing protein [Tannerella sp.]|jgi:gliding motility-associated-like protein|nr:gliding motility-associated C-terminal domain-containing protein [Tannerella sp.]